MGVTTKFNLLGFYLYYPNHSKGGVLFLESGIGIQDMFSYLYDLNYNSF